MRLLFLILTVSVLTFFTGCGQQKKIEEYQGQMNLFFEELAGYDDALNSLDPDSESQIETLLSIISSMEQSFLTMAALEVPKDYEKASEYAKEASDLMSEAASLYRQAFQNGYDEASYESALSVYRNAHEKLSQMILLFRGLEPEAD